MAFVAFVVPPGLPLIGLFPQVAARGLISVAEEVWREHGDYFQVRIGVVTLYFVVDPHGAQHILKDARTNYVKGSAYDSFRKLTGDGVLTANGEEWRIKRRRVQPAFHTGAVTALVDTMAELCEETLQTMRGPDKELDIGNALTHLTLRIVGRTLFGIELGGGADESTAAFSEALSHASLRGSGVRLPMWVPTPGNIRMKRALETLDESVFRIIDHARSEPSQPPTMLDMLLDVRDEDTGNPLTQRELRDEVMTMYLAGHETTALTLTWACSLLAERPDVQDELAEEAQSVLGDRLPRMSDCPNLPKLRAVIDETLRIRGPVWALARNVVQDDEIQGHPIPKGSIVVPSPFLIHQHPDYWDAPAAFRADRFLNQKPAHEYAYIPFSKGLRMCMGEAFALAESQVILSMLVREFRWKRADDQPIEPRATITLKPSHPIRIRVTPR